MIVRLKKTKYAKLELGGAKNPFHPLSYANGRK